MKCKKTKKYVIVPQRFHPNQIGELSMFCVSIKENKLDDLSDISVVSTKLKINKNNMGSVCVIGPTRMDYNQVIEALEFLNIKLEELEKDKKEDL